MFERFTSNAREVVVGAQHEARLLRHGSVGTEHDRAIDAVELRRELVATQAA